MKTVLITGASRGIGASIAEVFAKNNYNVIINYLKSDDLAKNLKYKLESKYNIKVYLYKADVSNEEEVKKMYNDIRKSIGNIDCLVSNAGIAMDNDIDSKDSSEFMKVIEVNLLGTYLMCKYADMVMDQGNIINISSNNGIKQEYVDAIDYDASKAGVISLTHSFAEYFAPRVRVNSVAPGWVNTDMNKELYEGFKKDEEGKILLQRFAEPEEIAEVVYFINEASYINDTVIRVDGGVR